METWILDEIASTGRSATGPIVVVRSRPWALVCSIDTSAGRLWAKFPHHEFAYEGRLATAIDRLAPGTVHVPFAMTDAGWMLSTDGGTTYTDHVDGEAALVTYLTIVRATSNDPTSLLEAGAPDRRPAALPDVWDALVEVCQDALLVDRLRAREAGVMDEIDTLAADGRVAICNTDLRPSHAFVGAPATIFDWGDATVAHPLCCLGNVRNFTRDESEQQQLIERHWGPQDPVVVRAAGVVESLLRADVWRRDPPGARERHPGMVDFWLADVLDQLDA